MDISLIVPALFVTVIAMLVAAKFMLDKKAEAKPAAKKVVNYEDIIPPSRGCAPAYSPPKVEAPKPAAPVIKEEPKPEIKKEEPVPEPVIVAAPVVEEIKAEPVIVAEVVPEPVKAVPEPEPEPIIAAPEPVPEPPAPEPLPEPVVEPEPVVVEPEPVHVPEPEPEVVVPEPEPVVVPEPEPEPVVVVPEPEPEPVVHVEEPLPELIPGATELEEALVEEALAPEPEHNDVAAAEESHKRSKKFENLMTNEEMEEEKSTAE